MNGQRRAFLRQATVLSAQTFVGGIVLARPRRAIASTMASRELSFEHLHTGERLDVLYAAGGRYVPRALAEVNHFLRDHYCGEVGVMDPRLLDQLYAIHASLACTSRYQVISGYRSRATNEALRRRSGGVASNSLHMQGRAIDVRLDGVPLAELHAVALSLKAGGVGFYPASNFVHVDTGRVRCW